MMKWNQEYRRLVYKKLFDEFGPLNEWHNSSNPTCNREEFIKVLERIAMVLSELSGNECERTAVEAQIAWGLNPIQNECTNRGYVSNFILNRSAAMEVGLIDSSNLPSHALFDYKK
jgi:hypothetical protein